MDIPTRRTPSSERVAKQISYVGGSSLKPSLLMAPAKLNTLVEALSLGGSLVVYCKFGQDTSEHS